MAKVNLAEEVVSNHSNEEVVDYLFGLASAIRRPFVTKEEEDRIFTVYGQVEAMYSVLKVIKERHAEIVPKKTK